MTKKEAKTKEKDVQKKLNLKNDIIFKAFFARKGNEEFLIDFLNALLDIEITKINIKEEVNIEKLSKYEKGGRLDLQAQLNDGIIVNIEMQLKNEYNIKERTVVYGAKTISRQTYRQMKYKEVKKVILVNILDYNMLGFEEYITRSKTVVENHREYELIDGIKWIFIELPKFRKSNPDMNNKLNQWLAFLDGREGELMEMAIKKNKVLQKAKLQLSYLTGEEEARRLEELEEKWEMDRNSAIGYAEEKGEKRGKIAGKKEKQIEIAKEMLKKNMEIKLISEITKLTIREVEQIKDSNAK